MPSIPLSQVGTLAGVARFLGCTADDLREIATADDQRCFYTRLQIPKRSRKRGGQFRTVYKADQRLGLIHKNVATWISEQVQFPEYVQGFVQKRSIVTNARIHLAQRTLIHADIKNFFDSITTQQVDGAFRALGCNPSVADTLARVCTLNGLLPQGSSASPILANVVCRHLDTDLNTLAVANQCKYSRYADDITISGDHTPNAAEIEAVLTRHGFSCQAEKHRIQRRGRRQYVTGLTVVDRSCPRVPRVVKRRLRLELHYADRYGVSDHLKHIGSENTPEFEVTRLKGWMSFIYSVEGTALQRMYEQWVRVENQVYGEPPRDE
jgi:RNA-directed DNA polymerase